MSILKANSVQLGNSATATQNFTLRSNADGSATLARGNVGATTQDILTVDADGRVAMPQSTGPAFRAYANASLPIASGTTTKVNINTEDYDTDSCFDTALNRFTPNVAGYYSVSGLLRLVVTSGGQAIVMLYKNGAIYARGGEVSAIGTGASLTFADFVFLNGSTDYIELYGYCWGTTPNFNFAATGVTSFFSAALVRAA